jgi:type I restriction enzyme S subunit
MTLVEKEFLHQLLILPPKRKEVQKLASGSAGSMPNISKHNLMKVEIELPPIALQRKFATRLNAIQDVKNRLTDGAQANEVVFSALQQRAFGGEL